MLVIWLISVPNPRLWLISSVFTFVEHMLVLCSMGLWIVTVFLKQTLCIDYPIDTMVFSKQCQGLSKVHMYLLGCTYKILILLYALKTVSTIEQNKA